MTPLPEGLLVLLVLAIPVAAIAWTVTHEDVFREVRGYCVRQSLDAPSIVTRKFFYLFTCEYCFSHYVTAVVLMVTGRLYEEATVLRVALAFERATKWHTMNPPMNFETRTVGV